MDYQLTAALGFYRILRIVGGAKKKKGGSLEVELL